MQPCPKVFLVNGSLICNFAALLMSSVNCGQVLSSLVNSSQVLMNDVCTFSQSETKKYSE